LTPEETAKAAVDADLGSARFLAGVARGRWRKIFYEFPILIVAVAAVEPDGKHSAYDFRFELTGFPGANPEVRIWDPAKNDLLQSSLRPKGSNRVTEAFKKWGDETVYRPWDRRGSLHNNWPRDFPALAWHPRRDLAFILEDLHGLLTSNDLAGAARAQA
jgi:hypothetical protein